MNDLTIRDTVAALDRALARIALDVTGNLDEAAALLLALDEGESTAATKAFLSQGAAMIRARLLLSDALRAPVRRSLRKAA